MMLLTGLWAAQTLWAAPGMSYLPGRLSVRFLENPVIEQREGALSLGQDFEAILADFPAREVRPLIRHMTLATVPDLSLNYLLSFDPSLDMEALAALFEATGRVEYAEPDYFRPVYRTPNDPSHNLQWTLNRVDAYEAWDLIPETPSNPEMIIAIIDSGVDWNHPDLINRIWVNPSEDLDQDGAMPSGATPGDPDDINGTDDGGNGYVDDFYGFDFVDGVTGCANGEDCSNEDNNPMDFNGHGTHCSGIAAAQTHNGVGVASIAWDARIMCLRAGYSASDGNGFVLQSAASEALYYATANGAKLVSMSFGGSGTIRTAASAAYNAGLLCFHAAGNESSNVQDGLDRATGMISVAATESNDCAASFTNYGDWVDVSAPGTSIYDTFFNNTYSSLDGTSMACPNVASCAALLWWMNPELNNAQVRERLLGTVDDIYGLGCNEDFDGMLGSGRINAYKALMNLRETVVGLSGVSLADADGDGHYLAGDTLRITYTVSNTGINPTQDLTATLTSSHPAVEILTPSLLLPAVDPDESLDGAAYPVLVRVLVDDPAYVDFTLTLSSANAPSQTGEISAMLGLPTILLYDDSAGETNLVSYYKSAFRQLGWILDWYRSSTTSFPELADQTLDLGRYDWVLYASGQNTATADAAEQTLFSDYVNGGHDLIFVSQFADEELNGTPFFSQLLEAVDGTSSSTTRGAKGVVGTFTEGISMILQGAGGANNQSVPITEVSVAADGGVLFNDNANAFPIAVHNGYGENRVAYLAFALEAAGGAGSSLNTGEVLSILEDQYLHGTGVQDPAAPRPVGTRLAPAWPNPFNPVTSVQFDLQQAAQVRLSACNLLGQEVAVLQEGRLTAGSHSRLFRADALPSGLYLLRLEVEGRLADQQKVMLIK